jgi:antitoxin PrlF
MNAVTVKGQVTIPKPIREALAIGPGSLVEFAMNQDGQVVLRKAGPNNPARIRSIAWSAVPVRA